MGRTAKTAHACSSIGGVIKTSGGSVWWRRRSAALGVSADSARAATGVAARRDITEGANKRCRGAYQSSAAARDQRRRGNMAARQIV